MGSNASCDNADRGCSSELTPSQSQREEDDDLGISITSSVAPSHNLKGEEVMLLLFRELAAIDQ